MSRGFNRVILMGNLARDPDIRHTPSKQKVARITVAVGRQWRNRNTGEVQSQVDFIPVVAWASLADLCERFLRKGKPILVEGRLQVREYDDPKTGARRWSTDVVADNMTLLSSGRREGDGYGDVPPPADIRPSDAPVHQQRPQEPMQGQDAGSLRDDINFDEEFPLNFMDLGSNSADDADVPF